MQPLVSLIVTVFNKEAYLPDTLRSLFWQNPPFSMEYIFVDDVSTDRSCEVIEQASRGMENVSIVRNTVNKGPSIRLNQGARLARGKYLQFFDSDDIMPQGTTQFMHALLEKHDADLAYGRWQRTQESGPALISRNAQVDKNISAQVSDEPLTTILNDSFTRMTLMVKKEVFDRAGGADERVFIQDESLPIRLGAQARRLVTVETPVLLVPAQGETLSSNKTQLNHDRFLANANMLHDQPDLPLSARELLFRRCVSAAWKQERDAHFLRGLCSWNFWYYLYTRLYHMPPQMRILARLEAYFARKPGVLRVA